MTIKNLLICDLCQMEFTNVNDVIGLRWNSVDSLEAQIPDKASTHLCLECVRNLKSFFDERKSKGINN